MAHGNRFLVRLYKHVEGSKAEDEAVGLAAEAAAAEAVVAAAAEAEAAKVAAAQAEAAKVAAVEAEAAEAAAAERATKAAALSRGIAEEGGRGLEMTASEDQQLVLKAKLSELRAAVEAEAAELERLQKEAATQRADKAAAEELGKKEGERWHAETAAAAEAAGAAKLQGGRAGEGGGGGGGGQAPAGGRAASGRRGGEGEGGSS